MTKATILLAVLLFVAGRPSAQITVNGPSTATNVPIGKAKSVGSTIAELYYLVNGRDTTCILMYENAKFKDTKPKVFDFQSVSFKPWDGTVEKLYQVFKSVFAEGNRDNKSFRVSITLGRENVSIGHYKSLGFTMAEFRSEKGFFRVTEKQTDKLFGK